MFLFLVAGLPAVFSAMVMPFSPATALPWLVTSWTIVIVSGYKVWRLDHPRGSARSEIRRRVENAVGATVALAALAVAASMPPLLVLAVGAVWCGVLVLVLYLVTRIPVVKSEPSPGPIRVPGAADTADGTDGVPVER